LLRRAAIIVILRSHMDDAPQSKHSAEPLAEPLLHASVYEDLRARFITGKITPGVGLSTRGLAAELGVSQMPVRDALSRLAAEGAVTIRSKRKIEAPPMSEARFTDLLECRLLLEPEAAVLALPHIGAALLKRLKEIDDGIDRAMEAGDVIAYMEGNFAFHFNIYRANGRVTLNRLIETLWLQFGPFMRVVYGRYGTANLVDQHRIALSAIEAGDAVALRAAIAGDIADGMGLIGRSKWAET
jgi:DNA-binding GntR family transcriptional regulator